MDKWPLYQLLPRLWFGSLWCGLPRMAKADHLLSSNPLTSSARAARAFAQRKLRKCSAWYFLLWYLHPALVWGGAWWWRAKSRPPLDVLEALAIPSCQAWTWYSPNMDFEGYHLPAKNLNGKRVGVASRLVVVLLHDDLGHHVAFHSCARNHPHLVSRRVRKLPHQSFRQDIHRFHNSWLMRERMADINSLD